MSADADPTHRRAADPAGDRGAAAAAAAYPVGAPGAPGAPADPLAPVRLTEASARRVLLVQAVESSDPPAALWSPEDAAWASRLATETAGPAAPPARWLEQRARHACERLLPRDAALAAAAAPPRPPGGPGRAAAAAAAVAFVAGLAADSLAGRGRIDLLAPPWLLLVAWNLAVYLLLAVRWPAPAGRSGSLRRWLGRALQRMPRTATRSGAAAALAVFAAAWAERGAALLRARAALVLHVAAAALALGLVAGLYLRGLVLDFRAGWQSTFLDAGAVHALLGVLLGPASAASGIALPDVAGVAALRVGPGAAATAPAAGWIHLLAVTLLLAVVLPRALLAAAAAAQAAWRARRVELPLAAPYYVRLLAAGRRVAPRVQVLAHGSAPDAGAALGLRALMAATLGAIDDAHGLRLEAPVRYGDEDGAVPPPPAGTTLRVALVDLAATPEAEAHGRWLAVLRAASPVPVVLLADEGAWQRRFAALPERTAGRRAAWRALAAAHGVGFASVDLGQPAAGAGRAALEQALEQASGPQPYPPPDAATTAATSPETSPSHGKPGRPR